MKKFELSTDNKIKLYGRTLYRIKACVDFVTSTGKKIHSGDFGGFVERESNLSQNGKAWIYDDAKVYDNAKIFDNAAIFNNAEVFGNSEVFGDAKVFNTASVFGDASIYGDAKIFNNANIWGDAEILEDAEVFDDASVHACATVSSNAKIYGNAEISCDATINEDAMIYDIKHIFYMSPIDESGRSLTFYRTAQNGIAFYYDFLPYTLDEFDDLISDWDDGAKDIAKYAVALARKYIKLEV